MPHPRLRFCTSVFERKLKFQRVVLVQGVRQCGKSFFLREIYAKNKRDVGYVTLDQPSEKKFAADNPETFLQKLADYQTVIIDEAQKVPELFDTVKYLVDKDPKPGQFVMAGSTEFSIKSNIRESLTGRATSMRLYPLTLAEALRHESSPGPLFSQKSRTPALSRAELMRHLSQGGMPGIFFVHEASERRDLQADWLQLTTQRDIQQLPGPKKDSQLAIDIMRQVALLEEPTAHEIARSLRVSMRKINSHVDALKTLFALVELPAFSLGTGKPRVYHCDVGFAAYFDASFKRQLETLYLQEIMAFREYFGSDDVSSLSYYRTTKGSVVDFVYRDKAACHVLVKIHDRESVNQLDIRNLINLAKKIDGKTKMICAAGVNREQDLAGARIIPWEWITSTGTN